MHIKRAERRNSSIQENTYVEEEKSRRKSLDQP
jgi:hypothetical protein